MREQIYLKNQNNQLHRYNSPSSEYRDVSLEQNEHIGIVSLAREIVHAQFILADTELTRRLWDEVASRDIDPDRVNNLLYRVSSHEDDESMFYADRDYLICSGSL